jgi:hypothetical protein
MICVKGAYSRSAFQGWPRHSLAELRVCPASFGFSGIALAAAPQND